MERSASDQPVRPNAETTGGSAGRMARFGIEAGGYLLGYTASALVLTLIPVLAFAGIVAMVDGELGKIGEPLEVIQVPVYSAITGILAAAVMVALVFFFHLISFKIGRALAAAPAIFGLTLAVLLGGLVLMADSRGAAALAALIWFVYAMIGFCAAWLPVATAAASVEGFTWLANRLRKSPVVETPKAP